MLEVAADGALAPLADAILPGLGRPLSAGETAPMLIGSLAARVDPASPALPGDPIDWPPVGLGPRRMASVQLDDASIVELGWVARGDGTAVLTIVDATHWASTTDLDADPSMPAAAAAGAAAPPTLSNESSAPDADRTHRARMRFFAAASHDLLQPLNAARVFALALQDQPGLGPQATMLARRIDRSLQDAEEVIDVLVDIARLDVGAVTAVIEPFELEDLVRGLIEQFSSIAAQRGLQLRMGPCAYRVRGDRRLTRRILQNLISNALRYTRSGGVLVGTRRSADGAIRIEVVDTGVGIAPEDLRRIFEEFQRLDAGSPWGERGLGLGLAICSRLAELLGYHVTVRSTPGRGSVFSLAIGVHASSQGSVADPSCAVAESARGPASELRVLCIDDDDRITDAMRCLLETWGATVHIAASHETALAIAHASPPDVVIADFSIDPKGRHTGLSTIAAIQAGMTAAPPRAVLVTAHRSESIVAAAKQAGTALLFKPVSAGRLRSIIDEVARSRERRR